MPVPYKHASLQHKSMPRWTTRRILRFFLTIAAPNIFIITLGIIFSAPFGIPGQSELQVGLILGTVWFWALYYPFAMPVFLLFITGLILELFVATPPGLLLLWMLVVYGVAHTTRFRFSQGGFFRYWALYSSILLPGAILGWLFMSIRAVDFLPFSAIFFQWILGIGVYPLLHVIFVRGRRFFNYPTRL